MASITITVNDISSDYSASDLEEGEFDSQLNSIAGIIESAIENAFGSEAVSFGDIGIGIDLDD
jgi:hypothetical protein